MGYVTNEGKLYMCGAGGNGRFIETVQSKHGNYISEY